MSIKGSFKLHFFAERIDSKDLYPLVSYYSDEQNRQALPEKSLFCAIFVAVRTQRDMPLEYNCLISQMSFWTQAWQLIFLSPVLISRLFQLGTRSFHLQALMLQVLTAQKEHVLGVSLITEVIILQTGEVGEEAERLLVPAAEGERLVEPTLSSPLFKVELCFF